MLFMVLNAVYGPWCGPKYIAFSGTSCQGRETPPELVRAEGLPDFLAFGVVRRCPPKALNLGRKCGPPA